MNKDGTEIHVIYGPVVSPVTQEFSKEFLDFWPFSSPPRILNWTQPFQTHLSKLPIDWILTESSPKADKAPRYIVTAFPYAGFTGVRIYQVKFYRDWVKSRGLLYFAKDTSKPSR